MNRKRYGLSALIGVLALAALVYALYRPAGAPVTPATGDGGYSLVVDLSKRRLYVRENGAVVRSYRVAVGRPSHPTPRGSFHIRHITWNPSWVPPDSKWARGKRPQPPGARANPMGKVKIFFKRNYYIHGTRDYDSLGKPESHGCIRMANGEAVALAREVMAHGGKPMPKSWFKRMLDNVRKTREVYLSHPILLQIHD